MVETTNPAKTSIPPPPRITGNDDADAKAMLDWFALFYLGAVRNAGLLRADQQLAAPPTFDPDALPDPTDTSLARAQDVANHAYALAATGVPSNPNLIALAGLTGAADESIYFTGPAALALYSLTAFARTLLDDPDAATMRATLGVPTLNALLTAIGGLSPTVADRMIYTTGVDTVALATITGFARSILDDPDAATVRATINAIASTVALAALAALTPAADRGIYFTSGTVAALFTLTAFARTLLDDVDAATARTTLGAVPFDLGTIT